MVFCAAFAPTVLAAEKTFKPDENGQIVFSTPTRNIGCVYTPKGGVEMYVPEDGGPELACDRKEPLYVRLILSARGSASIFKMVGDTACCSEDHILDYGDTWRTLFVHLRHRGAALPTPRRTWFPGQP